MRPKPFSGIPYTSILAVFSSVAGYAPITLAENAEKEPVPNYEQCLLKSLEVAGPDVTAQTIKENCDRVQTLEEVEIPKRILYDKGLSDNPYVITPHRQNYILPFTYMDDPNQAPYENQDFYPGIDDPVENEEVKLQLSIKVPLTFGSILVPNDTIYFGFTLKSFWQLYASDISSPFRETNYRPEIFYEAPIPKPVLGGTLFTRVGIEHESNGRSSELSRSWNRVYAGLGFAKKDWAVYVQPWYRLPEDDKEYDGDPSGDDNPDINTYMGYYEVFGVYRPVKDIELSGMGRYNWGTGYGAIEVGMSFPLYGRLRGYAQYFHGYGESLIDYNYNTQRFGLGVLLTDFL